MQTFNYALHKVETQYPESSIRVQFGKSWQFAAKPDAPDQRVFKLTFSGFKYYIDENGQVEAETNEFVNNLYSLELFYQSVRLYEKFVYPHPVYGNVVVRFNKPLLVPKGVHGGNGVVEDFTIEFVEQP